MSRLPPELGRLVETHRPLRPLLGWGIVAVISCPLAVFAALSAPGPWVGLALLLGFGLPITYGLGEWLFLRHRLYEHGIVFDSVVGLPRYVIPHYTVQPDRMEIGGRRVHDGGVVESVDRRFRQCPLVGPTLRFTGLDPTYARHRARATVPWDELGRHPVSVGATRQWVPRPQARWMATYRDPEPHLALLRSTVRASQETYPYVRAGATGPL